MLQGRVAIITGASRGIGREFAKSLSRNGCRVVLASKTGNGVGNYLSLPTSDPVSDPSSTRNPTLPGNVFELSEKINARIGEEVAFPFQMDVRNAGEMKDLVNFTVGKFDRLDILVNNAGAMWWKSLEETPIEKFDLMHDINVRATYELSRLCVPQMEKNGWGHLVHHSPPFNPDTIESALASDGHFVNRVAYLSSKWGMSIVSAGLARELGGTGIASNTIWPRTMIDTQATRVNKLGDGRMWRKPEIMSDMLLQLLEENPYDFTGKSLLDETYLRTKGVTDFSKYQTEPGYEPPSIEVLLRALPREK
jgi:citronellol/citronellal dehydrogenase